METRANYVLIGVFTLAVIAGAFGFVWWFQRIGDAGTRVAYEVVYDGAVSGLRTGSAVLFNGLRVGEVTSIGLDLRDPRKVVAGIAVASTTPIRSDTKAGLELQGLTGIAAVSLTGGSPTAPPLKGEGGNPPRLQAESSGLADLIQGARTVLVRVESIALRIDKLIESNEKKIDEILANVATATKEVASFTKDLTGKDGRTVATEIADTAREITATAKSFRELAEHLDKTAGPTVKEYHQLATDARRAVGDISRVIRDFERNPSQILFGRRGTPAPAETTAPATTSPFATQPQPAPAPARPKQKQKQKQP